MLTKKPRDPYAGNVRRGKVNGAEFNGARVLRVRAKTLLPQDSSRPDFPSEIFLAISELCRAANDLFRKRVAWKPRDCRLFPRRSRRPRSAKFKVAQNASRFAYSASSVSQELERRVSVGICASPHRRLRAEHATTTMTFTSPLRTWPRFYVGRHAGDA